MKKNKIIQFFNINALTAIIVLALVIRIGLFLCIQPWDNEVVNSTILITDASGYHKLALSLLTTKSFTDFDAFRTPGYPLFLAVIYSLFSVSVWMVLLIQIILNLVSIVLVYKIGAEIFSKNIALLSAFLFAIDVNPALFSLTILTDTLFVFLFLISIYYLCKRKIDNFWPVCLSALFLGIATLVRPVSFLFPIFAIIFILVINNLSLKKKIIYSLIYGVVFVFAISPWILRNYTKYGIPKLSSISGYNLLYYSAASTESFKTGKPIEEVRKDFYQMAVKNGCDTTDFYSFGNSAIFSDIAGKYIKENLLLYSNRHFRGTVNLYCGVPLSQTASIFHRKTNSHTEKQFSGSFKYTDLFSEMPIAELSFIGWLFFFLLIIYLFSAYGFFVSFKKKNKRQYIYLFILIILYFTVLTGVVGVSRYRLPFMPFIYMLSALGIISFYNRIMNDPKSELVEVWT